MMIQNCHIICHTKADVGGTHETPHRPPPFWNVSTVIFYFSQGSALLPGRRFSARLPGLAGLHIVQPAVKPIRVAARYMRRAGTVN